MAAKQFLICLASVASQSVVLVLPTNHNLQEHDDEAVATQPPHQFSMKARTTLASSVQGSHHHGFS